MNYKGKLYGRIGNNTYFDTAYTTDDWDAMEAKIKEIEKVKRKPLPDGTLELTKEEIKTVEEMTGICFIAKVVYTIGKLRAVILADSQTVVNILNVKAILWLAERFELIKED